MPDQEAHKNSHTIETILDTTPATVHTNGAANPHQIISRLHTHSRNSKLNLKHAGDEISTPTHVCTNYINTLKALSG
jgi:hypothetical protein